MTDSPPANRESQLTSSQLRVVAAGALGLSAEAAAAAGCTEQSVQAILSAAQQGGAADELVTNPSVETPTVDGDDATRPGDRERPVLNPEGSLLAACRGAGVPLETARALLRCRSAEAAGLPAEFGAAMIDARTRDRLARALTAERRAARLGRELDSAAAELLRQTRSTPEVVAAAARVQSNAAGIRAVVTP